MPVVTPLPLADRIGDHIKATLAGIVSDGIQYSYTPDAGEVKFVEDLNVDKLPTSKQLVYWIFQGEQRPEEAASKTFKFTDYFSIFAAYRAPAPYGSALIPKTIRTLIAQDLHRALTADVTRGGLARNTEVTEIEPVRVDNTVLWICVSAFVVVTSKETRF